MGATSRPAQPPSQSCPDHVLVFHPFAPCPDMISQAIWLYLYILSIKILFCYYIYILFSCYIYICISIYTHRYLNIWTTIPYHADFMLVPMLVRHARFPLQQPMFAPPETHFIPTPKYLVLSSKSSVNYTNHLSKLRTWGTYRYLPILSPFYCIPSLLLVTFLMKIIEVV